MNKLLQRFNRLRVLLGHVARVSRSKYYFQGRRGVRRGLYTSSSGFKAIKSEAKGNRTVRFQTSIGTYYYCYDIRVSKRQIRAKNI